MGAAAGAIISGVGAGISGSKKQQTEKRKIKSQEAATGERIRLQRELNFLTRKQARESLDTLRAARKRFNKFAGLGRRAAEQFFAPLEETEAFKRRQEISTRAQERQLAKLGLLKSGAALELGAQTTRDLLAQEEGLRAQRLLPIIETGFAAEQARTAVSGQIADIQRRIRGKKFIRRGFPFPKARRRGLHERAADPLNIFDNPDVTDPARIFRGV